MEKVMAEDSVLSEVKEIELSFWADETERELYFQHQQLLMDTCSAEHTYDFLLEQARENIKKERERAEQEKERAEKAERDKEKAAQDGLEQGKREMARNMLKLGFEMDRIVQASGLSEEEIRGRVR
ncbi:MAG: hypothetical protein LBO82_08710 [Synergistaceae bacterium]|jgi:predicted transposase/invertase (TIGR01784 family)|nr:hypothetical protein [Synergistaceae bacterium]